MNEVLAPRRNRELAHPDREQSTTAIEARVLHCGEGADQFFAFAEGRLQWCLQNGHALVPQAEEKVASEDSIANCARADPYGLLGCPECLRFIVI